MSRVLSRRRTQPASQERFTFSDWMSAAARLGINQPTTTWQNQDIEPPPHDFESVVSQAYNRNGVVFACILARMMLFSEARFQWQDMTGGRPGRLFGNRDLALLETPWRNATTGTLLARAEQDVSLSGNAYIARREVGGRTELRRLRPDRVAVVYDSPSGEPDDIDVWIAGYLYWPKGYGQGDAVRIMPEEMAHFAPIPDPTAAFRGMSWLSTIVEEVTSDTAATRHKGRFFENAATPNLAVSLDKALPKDEFVEFVNAMREHEGAENAYKTMWLGGGADIKVVGADLKQLDFKIVQGAGETRIAAAAGVPPIIVGLSEGLQAATYSNYGQARRKFGDHFAHPQWRMMAGALQSILPQPAGETRLWYDASDIKFLQEDQMDAAEILSRRMLTVEAGVRAGFDPTSVVAAVDAMDLTQLSHTGLYSVQLQPPTAGQPAPQTEGTPNG